MRQLLEIPRMFSVLCQNCVFVLRYQRVKYRHFFNIIKPDSFKFIKPLHFDPLGVSILSTSRVTSLDTFTFFISC